MERLPRARAPNSAAEPADDRVRDEEAAYLEIDIGGLFDRVTRLGACLPQGALDFSVREGDAEVEIGERRGARIPRAP